MFKTLIVFGAFNFASLPSVYFFFPETNKRTLEEINLLFASDGPLVKDNEREFRKLLGEAGGNVAVAERRLLEEVNDESSRKESSGSADEEVYVEGKGS
jgi:hypothetical protein